MVSLFPAAIYWAHLCYGSREGVINDNVQKVPFNGSLGLI